jgi:hypothetical protein
MNRATLMAVAAMAAMCSGAAHVIQATGAAARRVIEAPVRSTAQPHRWGWRKRKPNGGSVKKHARAMAKKRRR